MKLAEKIIFLFSHPTIIQGLLIYILKNIWKITNNTSLIYEFMADQLYLILVQIIAHIILARF